MATVLDINLLTTEAFEEGPPHDIFDRLRRDDPVFGQPNPLGGTIWSLTRNADIRKVSGDLETFCSGQGIVWPNHPDRVVALRKNLMFNDAPVHTRLRGFVAKAFGPAVVARFEGWVRELCVEIVDNVEATDGAPFDAVKMISAALPSQVIASILGVSDEDRAEMVDGVMTAIADFDPDVGPEKAAAAYQGNLRFALRLRDKKLVEPAVDMTTELATPDPDGPEQLDDREYSETVAAIMAAGFETTHSLIAQSLVLMATNPDVVAAVDTTDRKRLSLVIDELLRYVTPTMYFGRMVLKETELHGKQLSVGDFVLLWYTAANRDPEVFEDPHSFNPDRPRKPHVAFGAGGAAFLHRQPSCQARS